MTEPVKAAVAFEELTSTEVTAEGEDSPKGDDTPETTSDDNQVADHKDINDEDQTVTSKIEPKHPKIATQAKLDGKDQVVAGATVNDTVKYKDLVPGKKYTLSASLVDKSDETKVLGKGTKEFTPDEANGEVVVPITVDQSVTEPVKAAVAFEELTSTEVTAEGEDSPKGDDTPETTSDDNQVADHKDINDEDQTVTSKIEPKHPKIATQAKLDGKDQVVAGATVNDTVKYKDLVPGKKYTLSASLVDKTDESKVLGKGTKEFTPSEADGEVVVPITVDDSVTDVVKAAVAFEELTSTEVNAKGEDSPKGGDTPDDASDDNQVADHKDINDENQTVTSEDQPTESAAPTTTSEAPTTTSEAPTTTSEAPKTPVVDKHPEIATQAKLDGKDQVVAGATVNDTVTFKDLVPGKKYTLSASLVDKSDESKVLGRGTKEFTPDEADGEVVVPITVDQSVTEPVKAAVAFEELSSTEVTAEGEDSPKGADTPEATSDDNQVAEHKDINDENQTVTSEDQPTESESPTTTSEAPAETTSEVPTTTSEAPAETTSEVPSESSEAPISTKKLAPTESAKPELPVSEVTPKIQTEAKFADKKEIVAGTVVNDTVTYTNLIPGKQYTLTAELMDKADGTTVVGHGSVTFTPESTDGSVVVPITVDDSVTEVVPAAVAFETLTSTQVDAEGKDDVKGDKTPETKDDNQVAKHRDITDQKQTVTSDSAAERNPKIATEAKFENKKEIVAGTKINDTVMFEDLVPNTRYTLTAQLMDKKDGTTVLGHGSTSFIPTTSNGSVVVPITVDESVTQPVASAVAFESLTSTDVDAQGKQNPQGGDTPDDVSDDNQIAEHKDINDDNQTVTSGESKPSSEQQVIPAAGKPAAGKPGVPAGQGRGGQPSISTHAEIKDNGPLVEGAVVVDQVRFTGLQPGKKYTLEANLVCKADGQPTQARSTVEFVPNQADGKVNVPISVTDAGCSEQVAFETLKDASGAVVATHHDITDADQTVTDHDQPGPNGPGDDQVTPDEGVTVLDQGGVPDSGAPLPADAGRQEIRSIPSGAAHLDAGMPLFV
ncbi:hypothetical protein CXF48_08700 [Corynebacterium bovis]|uniref:T-Q ester bond containing domain-containing protein n=1 Tax=Corynebacterium bovis TaxID=36808 RepID=A0A426PX79_9CORY|nr:hypothetical protein CXF48_08700 [Corynebacterium bovis]